MADPIPPTRPSPACYERKGALAYLAAWDVHRAKVFGRCEAKTIVQSAPEQMNQAPYKDAKRVFLIIDNASAHRGDSCIQRLQAAWPNIVPVHLPVHAIGSTKLKSFSIIQRKVHTQSL